MFFFNVFLHRSSMFQKEKARQGSRQLSMHLLFLPENLSTSLPIQFPKQVQRDKAGGCGLAKHLISCYCVQARFACSTTGQANESGDLMLRQGIMTLLSKLADREDGWIELAKKKKNLIGVWMLLSFILRERK